MERKRAVSLTLLLANEVAPIGQRIAAFTVLAENRQFTEDDFRQMRTTPSFSRFFKQIDAYLDLIETGEYVPDSVLVFEGPMPEIGSLQAALVVSRR